MPFRNKGLRKKYNKWYRETQGQALKDKKKSYWKNQRLQVLSNYSDGALECKCCGEPTYEFLAIDHIDGGGTQHRKSLGSKYIYSWLIQNNYPKGYQVLCHNCNSAKAFYKICPHELYNKRVK